MNNYYNTAIAGRRRNLNEIEGAFVATIETTSGSHHNQTIGLPLVEGYSYDFTIYWGDGTFDYIDSWDSPNKVHVYPPKARRYKVQIVGSMPMWRTPSVEGFFPNLISIKTCGDVGFCEGETDFSNMFWGCSKLESIPLLDTSNGTDFSTMFRDCSKLESIPLLNTSNGTDFSNMFEGCSKLESIPLLDTSNGTDFSNMFFSCRGLESIPLLNTSNGTDFNSMFCSCRGLESIPLLNTSNGKDFNDMFSYCVSLSAVPSLDMTSGIIFNKLFYGCENLETVSCDFGSNGEEFFEMFLWCKSLTSVPAIDTRKGKIFMEMFYGCESLTTIPGFMVLNAAESQEPAGYPTPYRRMFYNCTSLESLKLVSIIFDINFEDCPLSDYEVRNDIYSNLATISGKTIKMPVAIPGEDDSIATSKGWVIIRPGED